MTDGTQQQEHQCSGGDDSCTARLSAPTQPLGCHSFFHSVLVLCSITPHYTRGAWCLVRGAWAARCSRAAQAPLSPLRQQVRAAHF
jgi:hypothetical protein